MLRIIGGNVHKVCEKKSLGDTLLWMKCGASNSSDSSEEVDTSFASFIPQMRWKLNRGKLKVLDENCRLVPTWWLQRETLPHIWDWHMYRKADLLPRHNTRNVGMCWQTVISVDLATTSLNWMKCLFTHCVWIRFTTLSLGTVTHMFYSSQVQLIHTMYQMVCKNTCRYCHGWRSVYLRPDTCSCEQAFCTVVYRTNVRCLMYIASKT